MTWPAPTQSPRAARTAPRADARRATRTRPASSSATASGSFWERYGDGEPDDPADADVVDRPLAPLEAADPLPRPPLPGRHVRRPRQRPIRPPDRPGGLRGHRVRRRRPRRPGRDRHRAGGGRRGCRWARASRCGSPSSTRIASSACACSARPSPSRSQAGRPRRRRRRRLRRAASPTTRAGHKYNAHYWRRDWPGFAGWFFGEADVHRAALDQAGRGHGRLVLETDPETMITDGTGAVPRAAGGLGAPPAARARPARSCAACAVRPWSSTAPTTTSCRSRIGRQARGGARRAARRDRGRRPLPASDASPSSSTWLIRDFVASPGATPMTTDRWSRRRPTWPSIATAAGLACRTDGLRGRRRTASGSPATSTAPAIRRSCCCPSAPIVHSRQWKAQVHYLSRRWRVVTYDGRGNGRSDRPTGPGRLRGRPDRRGPRRS